MTVSPMPTPQDHLSTRKVTAGSKRRKQESMDAEASGLRIDGVDYVVNPNDVTGSVERKIRAVIGKGFAELQMEIQKHPGMDLIGEFMWAVRFANGETNVSLDEVLDSISYASDFEQINNPEPGPKA